MWGESEEEQGEEGGFEGALEMMSLGSERLVEGEREGSSQPRKGGT